jgi:predicted DNA-binding protein (MmcQ/YjbR family)
MTAHEVREFGLSLPGATEEIQWGKDLLLKVAGKMFVCMGLDPGSRYSFKCSEETFYELTEVQGVYPAPYLARAHWVQIDPAECRLSRSEIERLIRQSYGLVVAKLPKKTQKALVSE